MAGVRHTLGGGHAFSVEPGIYIAGARSRLRLEDIVGRHPFGSRAPERRARADLAVVG